MKFYTGIGSRQTPPSILELMSKVAEKLDATHTLRSGGADGADSAFENHTDNKVIYLPWKSFNDNDSKYNTVGPMAFDIAKQFHPAWERLSQGGQKLMARNVYQVLGHKLDSPSSFVICWTPNGELKGGTALAIKLAMHYKIPVFNLANKDARDRLTKFIGE